MNPWSLDSLPAELFRHILACLSPEETSSLARTCHRMNVISHDEQIWCQHFLRRYSNWFVRTRLFTDRFHRYTYFGRTARYSNDEYLSESNRKFVKTSKDSTWRELFAERAFQEKHIRTLLNEIIANRTNREFTDEQCLLNGSFDVCRNVHY